MINIFSFSPSLPVYSCVCVFVYVFMCAHMKCMMCLCLCPYSSIWVYIFHLQVRGQILGAILAFLLCLRQGLFVTAQWDLAYFVVVVDFCLYPWCFSSGLLSTPYICAIMTSIYMSSEFYPLRHLSNFLSLHLYLYNYEP